MSIDSLMSTASGFQLLLFIRKLGKCCSGLNSRYQIIVGHSKLPTVPLYDKSGSDLVDEGGNLLVKTKG